MVHHARHMLLWVILPPKDVLDSLSAFSDSRPPQQSGRVPAWHNSSLECSQQPYTAISLIWRRRSCQRPFYNQQCAAALESCTYLAALHCQRGQVPAGLERKCTAPPTLPASHLPCQQQTEQVIISICNHSLSKRTAQADVSKARCLRQHCLLCTSHMHVLGQIGQMMLPGASAGRVSLCIIVPCGSSNGVPLRALLARLRLVSDGRLQPVVSVPVREFKLRSSCLSADRPAPAQKHRVGLFCCVSTDGG